MSQSLSKVYLHIVFSTKERRDVIPDERMNDVWSYVGGVVNSSGGQSIKVGGTRNHVHILCSMGTTTTISTFLRDIKSRTSRWLNSDVCVKEGFAWQSGYAVFSVSQSVVPSVIAYISNQQQHHKKMSFKEELIEFLNKYGIDYDEKYIWE